MDLIAKARRDLSIAETRAERAHAMFEHAQRQVHQLKSVVEWLEQNAAATTEDKAVTRDERSRTASVADVGVRYIHEARTGVSIEQVEAAVREKGLTIPGKKPRQNLAGYLSRNRRVKYVPGVGWVPADFNYEAPSSAEGAKSTTGVGRGGPASSGEDGGANSLFAHPGAIPADPGS